MNVKIWNEIYFNDAHTQFLSTSCDDLINLPKSSWMALVGFGSVRQARYRYGKNFRFVCCITVNGTFSSARQKFGRTFFDITTHVIEISPKIYFIGFQDLSFERNVVISNQDNASLILNFKLRFI